MAIVAKAVFEKMVKEHGGAGAVGDVLPADRYTSTHKALTPLEGGGALFLVTVRPPDEALWLVAILESPELGANGWTAAPSTIAITEVSQLKTKLAFSTGAGITAKPGALGMSLQTPRQLTDADVALLRGATGGKPAKPAKATAEARAATKAKPAKPAANAPAAAKAPKPARVQAAAAPLERPRSGAGLPAAAPGSLDAIAAAIAAADALAALDAALVAWRGSRAPVLAELVDTISSRIATTPAITTDADWTAVARAKDPAHTGRLLAALGVLPASFLPTVGGTLATFPPDPRIAMAIATVSQDPPTTSSSNHAFWSASIGALGRIGDVRALPLIAARLKLPMAKSSSAWASAKTGGVSQFWPKFYNLLTKAQKALGAVSPGAVDPKAVAALGKLAAKLPITMPSANRAVPVPSAAGPAVGGPPLAQAIAHLGAGRVPAAIDAMLIAWRASKAPALADLLDRASRLLPAHDQVLPLEPKAAHTAWLAAFADDPMLNLPLLLHGVNAGGTAAAERHILDLASLPDDPRIALRLTEITPFYGISPERAQYWKSLLQIIGRTGDVRTVPLLRREYGDFSGTYFDHHSQARKYVKDFALRPPTIAAPDAAMVKQLGAIATILTTLEAARDHFEDTLLDAIDADWANDGPRLVYADWLLERGHPRGERIVLGCRETAGKLTDVEKKRVKLFRGVRDLGAISEVSYDLDRGLPVTLECGYAQSTQTWHRIADEPLLRFVTSIDWEDRRDTPEPPGVAAVMQSPHARKLTKVSAPDRTDEQHLADDLAAIVGPRWKRDVNEFTRAT
ncbi:MAG: TIGR02996 domain-containing protein [Kofleriaceae bacterium]